MAGGWEGSRLKRVAESFCAYFYPGSDALYVDRHLPLWLWFCSGLSFWVALKKKYLASRRLADCLRAWTADILFCLRVWGGRDDHFEGGGSCWLPFAVELEPRTSLRKSLGYADKKE